ncbi:MetQ/NlpA family ABC transporter substrate-binding protein [Vagococcus fluvialis]|uniref:MetQ/NlpA family ABC transporter substrate-binding protein n=1 Tax=Vagococcus fluvialis TaxID=2738 RepID=UPI001A8C59ED|nr:MetQ/NlpA family ABC transporter substrate-binding protein [Vagococcus fluvialis]MBO0437076.1 MetQ/NlpA family ABC transporter substrate-binding protein [Vagococcus fluvialis]MDT2747669.1 MetQ/NlpA family ABC transporter substrate-binding protein [Vagococcus fluvialis]MDT2780888.1 MetQ/NlpA family ABC transporter substrate-binding protein [Vagococcus fluvialis]UDM71931.1 MetQ/NlpA family ABC transporter substrate-binding protein [Vagococcus fluvialis]UDM76796.1 MetQ/NlpA family ABC transpor
MKKIIKYGLLLVALAGVATACSKGEAKKGEGETKTVKLGIIGDDTDVWDDVKNRLKDEGIKLEYVKFSDYNQPNSALADGSIDLNAFQHQFFLDNYNKEHGTDLVSIGNTVNAPMAIFSEKVKDIKDVKDGGEVAIPNDVTNGGRALLLLQTAGLIKIDEKAGITPTVSDITENSKNLKITELDASQTARALQDVDLSVINSGVAVDAGFNPQKDSIFAEPVDENSKPYVNIIVSRKEDEKNETYQKIVDAYQTDETKKVIDETSKNTSFPAWETFGRK